MKTIELARYGPVIPVIVLQRVEDAVRTVLDSGIRTPDLGGKAGTNEVGDAIVSALRS